MDLALIALSARPLAASAARAGFAALSLDLFADLDTCAHSARCVRVHKKAGYVFDGDDLIHALATLSPAGLPVILGGGLEDDPELMARVAARNPILGNGVDMVRVIKDPIAMDGLCRHLAVPFPAVSLDGTGLPEGPTLEKKIGGAGGGHIRRRAPGDLSPPTPGYYLQQEVAGTPYSLLLLTNGKTALVVGASRQWRAADAEHPFRYGGAIGPVALPAAHDAAMRAAATRLALACGLVGLVSMDFMVADDRWHLVEVNARPGATLDIFDVDPLPPLLGLHLAACGGKMPQALPAPGRVHLAGIIYADRDVRIPSDPLPAHVADRPAAGAAYAPGAPICTIKVDAATEAEAEALFAARAEELRALLGDAVLVGETQG